MIQGIVSVNGVPTITLPIAGEAWTAIIDMGFNGDLELPERLHRSLRARYAGRITSMLAGGRTIEEDVYLASFPFDGQAMSVEVTFAPGSQILVGTRLLREHHLRIDFVGKSVVLERVR